MIFEFIVALATLVATGVWFWVPENMRAEPTIAVMIGVGVFVDAVRRMRTVRRDMSKATKPRQPIAKKESDENEPDAPEAEDAITSSTTFFYQRFTDAFPGVTGTKEFRPFSAVKRREILLREPLSFQLEQGGQRIPIWWWRDGELNISDFRVLRWKTVLIDGQELRVRRLVAVNARSYYQCFVYLESVAMRRSGLYKSSVKAIKESVSNFGYAREEYALLDGKRKISRSDYDDGSTIIWGRPTRLRGRDLELRTRYLTPYNLVLAPANSPINNGDFRHQLSQTLSSSAMRVLMTLWHKFCNCLNEHMKTNESINEARQSSAQAS